MAVIKVFVELICHLDERDAELLGLDPEEKSLGQISHAAFDNQATEFWTLRDTVDGVHGTNRTARQDNLFIRRLKTVNNRNDVGEHTG